MAEQTYGIAGRMAAKFMGARITPLLGILALLAGLLAVMLTPREEEPQIKVPLVDIFIPFPGASAEEVESLVATPAEQVLSEIKGAKYVYSASSPDMAVITVRFEVGSDRTDALVKTYNKVMANRDWIPQAVGVGEPIVKPKSINDVPVVNLTLFSDEYTGYELRQTAHAVEAELKKVQDTADVYTLGGPDHNVRIHMQPDRMAEFGVGPGAIRDALKVSNSSLPSGELTRDNQSVIVQTGTFLTTVEETRNLVVGVHEQAPVYLKDVAEVSEGPGDPDQYVWMGTGPSAGQKGLEAGTRTPAVTVAVAKKKGTNAVEVAEAVVERFEDLSGHIVPEDIEYSVTRDYGYTANHKANELLFHLGVATVSVVLFIGLALGRKEGTVVLVVIPITLGLTLFASYMWGFTINRVSLFALIFSIGILVDDAIVVVENIHRHHMLGERSLDAATPYAVDEVGNPTILATFTVIAALLPMAFVTGLMGPYMSPIPINASFAMFFSLLVAFIITPWLAYLLLKRSGTHHEGEPGGEQPLEEGGADRHPEEGWTFRFYRWFLTPFFESRGKRWAMFAVVLVLMGAAMSLAYFKLVTLKMLPFDNKSELQVVVDMPEGTALETTAQVTQELGQYLATVPEVTDYQEYVGIHSPINFNGLVRQYYMREAPHQADIQVNLAHKEHRERSSHEIALDVRDELHAIGEEHGANVKIVEVPPGPPVLSPLVAEIYGPSYEGQLDVARQVEERFRQVDTVTDVDSTVEAQGEKVRLVVDKEKAARAGVSEQRIAQAISMALEGEDISALHRENQKYPLLIRAELPDAQKARIDSLLEMRVQSRDGALVPLAELVTPVETTRDQTIYHKNLKPVVYVTGDKAQPNDSPLYGLYYIWDSLQEEPLDQGYTIPQLFTQQPEQEYKYALKWDGEAQVTYETFRDMGAAYAVGLVLIFLLIVGQFRSYLVPVIIMAPIPLTVVGVMPGHALFGAHFTATSMIGMIALGGIIVRNSILLVDFINQETAQGVDFQEAVIRSGAVRLRPIVLTAAAAMVGAFVILFDPIFQGLAISLLFGIAAATLLTLVVIPVMYFAFMRKRMDRVIEAGRAG
ncbi:multidrug transporter AcrB [Thiohalorhabdus denitrificans]|uniref:Multidrug efflux pump subunit AcrB n=1 Tax=Thiohalorhabdus denitrificans TaxID=381306 RepID=A0A0P9GLJ4_9GAMM|nr:efflux RND transporter permease subunit [Thiohalorhabdus denitrificans]KPV41046.1 multidrug transporter AcrB [Thiohalorhabdus denitrificans]SCY40505.1 Multidrug efflux pump subunit AcrB [Thiohalorhabdus denitrificans]